MPSCPQQAPPSSASLRGSSSSPTSSRSPDFMASTLETLKDRVISVITNDGRNIVGTLKGYDQTTNIILHECHERVFSPTAGVEQVPLGLYIVRGDNIAVIGELDEELDAQQDLNAVRAEPLKPVVH